MATKEITYEIQGNIAVLSNTGSWATELNLISWNGAAPKYDIRRWNADHTRMGKGVTLSEDEMDKLLAAFSKGKNEEG